MIPRILIALLCVTLLTVGFSVDKTPAASAEQRTRINFHARDMIVPDFNSGRSTRCPERIGL